MPDNEAALYPVTIVRSRYGGTYEPGDWVAFPTPPESLPSGWDGGDAECARFWQEHPEFGGGATPSEAYEDLQRRQAAAADTDR